MTVTSLIGWGHGTFGRSPAPDTTALMADVVPQALEHAAIGPSDVDAVFVGVYNNGFSRQDFQGALVSMAVPGLAATPASRHENACATGAAALHAACDFIEAGRGRVALVVGAEKMTSVPAQQASEILLSGCWGPEEAGVDAGFAGVFAGLVEAYAQRYGDPRDAMARIAAKNHANATGNPYAQFRTDLGFAFCSTVSERNPQVAPMLRRTDCAPLTDGAAAVVVASADVALSAPQRVSIRARAHTNDVFALSRRPDPLAFDGAARAWRQALDGAGAGVADLDLLETHDCFTIAELLQYEAFGLTGRGEGYRALDDGLVGPGGALPVNPSGGLKARGHPLGATGVSQHVMAALQVTGTAGDMQVPGASLAAVFTMGGVAVSSYASVVEAW